MQACEANVVEVTSVIQKLNTLGISTTLCKWILDFLTNRPQSVRISSNSSSTLVLNTGAPQGCVLIPLPVHTVHPRLQPLT